MLIPLNLFLAAKAMYNNAFLLLNFALFSCATMLLKTVKSQKSIKKIWFSWNLNLTTETSKENILLIIRGLDVYISACSLQDERLVLVILSSRFHSFLRHQNDKVVVTKKYLSKQTETYIFINGLGKPLL